MKKHLTFFLLLISFFSHSQVQPCNCLVDLIYMNALITKLPSYTSQMVGDKRVQHERRYDYLKVKAAGTTNRFQCFLLISRLFSSIKDNHLQLVQNPWEPIRINPSNPFFIEMQAQEMVKYKHLNPSVAIDTDSLKKILERKPFGDIEGIYVIENRLKMGLYKAGIKDSLVGVIIESFIPNWEKGNIAMVLYEKDKGVYSGVECVFFQNSFISFNGIKHSNGKLNSHFPWTKSSDTYQYMDMTEEDKEKAVLKDMGDGIQYLRLGGYWSNKKIAEYTAFTSNLENNFYTPNVIVDLRYTGFYNEDTTKHLFKFFKKHPENKFYIMINSGNRDLVERLIADLKKRENIILVGENTSGTLSYGIKDSKTLSMPCNHDRMIVVNKDYSEYLEYEEVGIAPDIYLTVDSDWIQQTVDIIKNKKQ